MVDYGAISLDIGVVTSEVDPGQAYAEDIDRFNNILINSGKKIPNDEDQSTSDSDLGIYIQYGSFKDKFCETIKPHLACTARMEAKEIEFVVNATEFYNFIFLAKTENDTFFLEIRINSERLYQRLLADLASISIELKKILKKPVSINILKNISNENILEN